ncbi:hypothetical protein DWB85_07950 [Seongchinamella sediminis]|uniref:Uncharacterized protein n=1 Tax=Seongchinamella sediminis TaxID=2283635 RepID=A0A3L7DY95_9GAMM|nr:hypothetical protein DWB85_07950 [Seongchinamella sediminis]
MLDLKVAETYKQMFTEGFRLKNTKFHIDPNTALILTQPFTEYNTYTIEQEISGVERIAKEVRQAGKNPVLKLHPAEEPGKYEKLGLRTIEYPGPVEELLAGSAGEFCEVWSFYSSSLIFGSALFDIRSIAVRTDWNSSTLDDLDEECRALFNKYAEHRDYSNGR